MAITRVPADTAAKLMVGRAFNASALSLTLLRVTPRADGIRIGRHRMNLGLGRNEPQLLEIGQPVLKEDELCLVVGQRLNGHREISFLASRIKPFDTVPGHMLGANLPDRIEIDHQQPSVSFSRDLRPFSMNIREFGFPPPGFAVIFPGEIVLQVWNDFFPKEGELTSVPLKTRHEGGNI